MVYQNVVMVLLRHSESKYTLSFELALLRHAVLIWFRSFCTNVRVKLGIQVFPENKPLSPS